MRNFIRAYRFDSVKLVEYFIRWNITFVPAGCNKRKAPPAPCTTQSLGQDADLAVSEFTIALRNQYAVFLEVSFDIVDNACCYLLLRYRPRVDLHHTNRR